MGILHGWRTCPRCAGALDNGGDRAACAACGSVYFSNSAPCVCALVEDPSGRLLLARRAIEPYRGCWDVPGGFLHEGEHPLDGLRRELLEETGLVVEPERFLGAWMDVYGDAPDAQATLNLYWTARASPGDPVAADDVSELRWYAPSELPSGSDLAFTRLGDALEAWRRTRGGREPSGAGPR